MRFSHACCVSLLLMVLPSSFTDVPSATNREGTDKKCLDSEINRILGRLSDHNEIPIHPRPVNLFPELCKNPPVSNNDHWILHIAGCSLTLYSITSESQQEVTLERCHTIYKCWLVFDNTSICLFLSSEDNPQPAKRLYLDVLSVQQGKWTISEYGRQSVFFTFHHVDSISSSVALREITDDEKGRIAEFFIGNGKRLWRLALLLDYLSSGPELKYPRVCKSDHQVVQVSKAGTNNMLVVCDNQMILINLKLRTSTDITPPELKNMSLYSANLFPSRSGKTAFLTVESQGNATNCLIFLDTINTSSRCKVLPGNNTVTDGVFINDIFFALFNYTTVTVMNTSYMITASSYSATITNVCAVSNCHLYQTEKLLYIYGQQNTIVLDKDAYKPVTVQNASIHTVLPVVEKAYRNCNNLMLLPISVSSTVVVYPSSTALSSDFDSQSFMPSTIAIDISRITPSTTTSTMKSSILATTTTVTTPITRSLLLIQVVATANFEESTTPTSSIVAEKPNLKTLRSIIIPVVTASLGGLLVVMVTIIYCCCRGVKDQFSLNTQETMMKRNKFQLLWQTPLI